ncbi:MAG TPA: hypothetical protein VLH09_06785 [Bryobacteraceae bacterium]|nr:hypothetical protein [Bryobacteraceae bacterium]
MIRTQILLPPPMLHWLRRESQRLQIPVSEVIRRIIDKAQTKPKEA